MKPLATAEHAGGTIRVTRAGIDSVDAHESLHIAWQDCLGAVWDDPRLTVTVLRDGAARQHAWLMATPGQVPQVVRDRVASVVVAELTRTFDVHGAVRFIARRSGDAVAWLTLPDDAEWAATPQGTASIAAELADIRSAMGV